MDFKEYHKVINHLISHCGSLQADEKLCLICDCSTKQMAEVFYLVAEKISKNVLLLETPLATRHGQEPSEEVRLEMLKSDLIISLCKFSLAHSSARIEAGKKGARFLSLPLYTWDLLNDPSTHIDYKQQAQIVRTITDAFTKGNKVEILSKAGTNIILDITDRVGNYCPGFVQGPSDLGSPPDIESNISPIETNSNGVIVVDGSITTPELGLLITPVVLEIRQGKIVKISSHNSSYVDILNQIFTEPGRDILAECGIGLNPEAQLTGAMLTDEGALGCIHFGFGSNYTLGGQNKVDFHLDFVFRDATLIIDDVVYMRDGTLV